MTIPFSNYSPKITKKGILGPRFKDSHFCTKLRFQKNLTALISNITIVFSNSSPKIPKQDIFSPKFKDFHFCTKLCLQKNLRVFISNIAIAFSNFSPKNRNKIFLDLNLRILIFAPKFEGADFKYNNTFFQFLNFQIFQIFHPKNTKTRRFL